MTRFWCALTTALVLAACNPAVAPLRVDGGSVVKEADERRLWRAADEHEARLNASALVLREPALDVYLDSVVQALVPANFVAEDFAPRVRVLDSPYLNAFALPNGALYLHTGLLVRLESEAEVATLVGHELAHVLMRHGLRRVRSVKQTSALLGTVGVALPLVGLLGAVGAEAALAGYGRDLEGQADSLGFTLIRDAGYDVGDATGVFRHLLQDVQQTARDEPFFFGTHPRLRERIAMYEALAARVDSAGGRREATRYRAAVEHLVPDVAKADLDAGRYGPARSLLGRYLARHPADAPALTLMADALRLDPDARDLPEAETLYRRALASDDGWSPGWRGLGQLLRAQERGAEAADAFATYLRLHPTAPDRGFLEVYIQAERIPTPAP